MILNSASGSGSCGPSQADSPRGNNAKFQDFKAFASALNSGDVSGASQAFATLQQDMQKSGKPPLDPNSAAGKDFQAISDALKNGDVDGAKKAFASFRQDIRKAGHHHHHHADNDANANAAPQSPATPGNPSMNSYLRSFNATA